MVRVGGQGLKESPQPVLSHVYMLWFGMLGKLALVQSNSERLASDGSKNQSCTEKFAEIIHTIACQRSPTREKELSIAFVTD
jgi:hypothetical protein